MYENKHFSVSENFSKYCIMSVLKVKFYFRQNIKLSFNQTNKTVSALLGITFIAK